MGIYPLSKTSNMDRKDSFNDDIKDILQLKLGDEAGTNTEEELQEMIPEPEPEDGPIWKSKVWLACQTGDYLQVNKYLKDAEHPGLLIHGRDSYGNTALIIASFVPQERRAATNIMQLLLDAGADVNAINCKGRTALMEASLWGRLRAVKTLLFGNIQADTGIRDRNNLKAIDLASEDQQQSLERCQRCYQNGHVERPAMDVPHRERIVQLLLGIRDRGLRLPLLDSRTILGSAKIEAHAHKEETDQLQARLRNAGDEIEKLKAELKNSRITFQEIKEEIDVKNEKLVETEAMCKAQKKTISVTEKELAEAKDQVKKLIRQKADKDIQFREQEFDDETHVSFIKTFRIPLKFNQTGDRRKITIAYIEWDGNRYFAMNGTHSGLNYEFISSKTYAPKAHKLFKTLGFNEEESWFTHTEPQLMMLYMEHFLDREGLSPMDFKQLKGKKLDSGHVKCKEVRIFVSREVCSVCERLGNFINVITQHYGFNFVLEDMLTREK